VGLANRLEQRDAGINEKVSVELVNANYEYLPKTPVCLQQCLPKHPSAQRFVDAVAGATPRRSESPRSVNKLYRDFR